MSQPVKDERLVTLSALIGFEQEVRNAETVRDLAYIAVNDSRRVVSFRQAFIWHEDDFHRITIEAASNVAEVDSNAPYVRGLLTLATWITASADPEKVAPISLKEVVLPDVLSAAKNLAPYLVFVPLKSKTGALAGGMVFASDTPWREADIALLNIIGQALTHGWNAMVGRRAMNVVRAHLYRHWRRYLIALAVLFLLPVRQYVLAPAEVMPLSPKIIAAPMNGVIESVLVQPNDTVEAGQSLFLMEDIDLANKRVLAQRSVEVAQAEYLRAAQDAFSSDESRGKVPELKAMLAREQAALAWAEEQLRMAEVVSPVRGVVTYTDINDLTGQPVSTGQRVMTVSNPDETRLRIMLPVDDAIPLPDEADVVFYPSTNPLDRFTAVLVSASYEPQVLPEQRLAFTLHADFIDGNMPRMGIRGTAKVYGGRAPLIYLALRKPLSWLRRSFGV